MTQPTSRAAWNHLVAEGLLRGHQRLILDAMINLGPCTSGEAIDSIASAENGPKINNVNAWRARFTELSGRGLIREAGQRRCMVSGRLGIVWVPTARTKPLHVSKGARTTSDLKVWKALAEQMAKLLEQDGGVAPLYPPVRGVLATYRKLKGRK